MTKATRLFQPVSPFAWIYQHSNTKQLAILGRLHSVLSDKMQSSLKLKCIFTSFAGSGNASRS